MTKTKFVAHYPCRDGFTSLWIARQKYGNKASYLQETHANWNETKKLLADPNISELDIYYLDICPPRALLIELYNKANSVLVLDHHQSAEDICGDLPYVKIDKSRSGAGITWDFLYPDLPRPFLVDIVEDYDIWRFHQPYTKEYSAWLDTKDFTYKAYTEIAEYLESPVGREHARTLGTAYLEYTTFLIKTRLLTEQKLHYLKLADEQVVSINSPLFGSEIGDMLAPKTPNLIACIYYRSKNKYHFSLRSPKHGPDVAKIAEQYGGGGHANAAGFILDSMDQLQPSELEPSVVATVLDY